MSSNINKKILWGFGNNIAMIVICLIFLIPFLWMFLASFKSIGEIVQVPQTIFPQDFTFKNYIEIFKRISFIRLFLNSLVVTVSTTVLSVFTSSIAGYVFAKHNFKGKSIIYILCISGLMIPLVSTVLPIYLLISKLGLTNNYLGLILPFIVSPFGILLMRQFTEGIPMDLIEAARMDGASEFRIYSKIIVPLTSSAMATVGIFNFLYIWNQIFLPVMVMSKAKLFTLPLGIYSITYQLSGQRYDFMVTGVVISVIPVMIVFSLAQRHIVKGVTLTGMKL
ncbi:MAG: carbohydrate ABC transporter permease [Actinobacteria bacterium]|nr:carbohydrate ABC transporter permease [Actinomycetota bacterium]